LLAQASITFQVGMVKVIYLNIKFIISYTKVSYEYFPIGKIKCVTMIITCLVY
jgi:hypothetical protein